MNARKEPVPKAPRGVLHGFTRDDAIPPDWNGNEYCLCGKPGKPGDDQHPFDAPPLVAIGAEPVVLAPTPDEAREIDDRRLGEAS